MSTLSTSKYLRLLLALSMPISTYTYATEAATLPSIQDLAGYSLHILKEELRKFSHKSIKEKIDLLNEIGERIEGNTLYIDQSKENQKKLEYITRLVTKYDSKLFEEETGINLNKLPRYRKNKNMIGKMRVKKKRDKENYRDFFFTVYQKNDEWSSSPAQLSKEDWIQMKKECEYIQSHGGLPELPGFRMKKNRLKDFIEHADSKIKAHSETDTLPPLTGSPNHKHNTNAYHWVFIISGIVAFVIAVAVATRQYRTKKRKAKQKFFSNHKKAI